MPLCRWWLSFLLSFSFTFSFFKTKLASSIQPSHSFSLSQSPFINILGVFCSRCYLPLFCFPFFSNGVLSWWARPQLPCIDLPLDHGKLVVFWNTLGPLYMLSGLFFELTPELKSSNGLLNQSCNAILHWSWTYVRGEFS